MSIQPVHILKAITLTDQGILREILGWVYVTGAVPIRVCTIHAFYVEIVYYIINVPYFEGSIRYGNECKISFIKGSR